MNLKDLRHLDKDELLGMVGLETKHSTAGDVASMLGTFGVGLLVGAGIALLLAPKAGHELREDIREKLRRSQDEAMPSALGQNESMGVGKTY
jgi:Zn-dependent protease with chaperone function